MLTKFIALTQAGTFSSLEHTHTHICTERRTHTHTHSHPLLLNGVASVWANNLLKELQWKPKSIYLKQENKRGASQKLQIWTQNLFIGFYLCSSSILSTYNQCNITTSHNHRKFKSVNQKKTRTKMPSEFCQ